VNPVLIAATVVGLSNTVPMQEIIYKTLGETKLKLHVFRTDSTVTNRPVIVFFHGGAWRAGSPQQFFPQCEHLAARGMVAISAQYRLGDMPVCVTDAKSAMRWVRTHAAELGVDSQKIAAGGGSAGGHLAACLAVVDGFDEAGEDTQVSTRPAALVLFNPALDVTRHGGRQELSPAQQVRAGLPPTIIFHGTADTTVPVAVVEEFTKAMRAAGNVCELVLYEGRKHAFFTAGADRASTLDAADRFLVKLGYLPEAK
jgi:acetyl esterase